RQPNPSCYFCGKDRMESVHWLLATAGVEFEEFCETKERCETLYQVPLVETDGMVWTQTRAVLSHLDAKSDLYGQDLRERVRTGKHTDGPLALPMMAVAAFKPPKEKEEPFPLVVKKAETQYWPIFENILKDHREDFLFGNKFSWADGQLLRMGASVLCSFPLLKAFKTWISNIPAIKKSLQPGSQRKPPPDSQMLKESRTFCNS
uniref:glutathione transferase n=1 Tax=Otolemur garnettii TaxID=30611 RepID=H0XHH9_OTOGA